MFYDICSLIWIPLVFMGSLLYLLRTALILSGLLKGPIVVSFQRYGDDEPIYFPLVTVLTAIGLLFISGASWLSYSLRANFVVTMFALGVIFLILAWLGFEQRYRIRRYEDKLLIFPLWYRDLRERTSREERRRIGYMWMRLPWKTRFIYNSNSRAFSQWADFVIMATRSPIENEQAVF